MLVKSPEIPANKVENNNAVRIMAPTFITDLSVLKSSRTLVRNINKIAAITEIIITR